MSKLGQEPAFPIFSQYGNPARYDDIQVVGISKRFYAACAAMQGMLANPNTAHQLQARLGVNPDKKEGDRLVVEQAFLMADELLKQETL